MDVTAGIPNQPQEEPIILTFSDHLSEVLRATPSLLYRLLLLVGGVAFTFCNSPTYMTGS